LPRQDGNQNGWIKGYAVYVSDNPDQWGNPVTEGNFEKTSALKKVAFPEPVKAQHIRFVAKNGFGNDVYASTAEINVIIE